MHKTLCTDADLKALEARFNEFSAIEHITELKDVFLPKVAAFSDTIDEWEASVQRMNEVIRQFDETLSLKANKS